MDGFLIDTDVMVDVSRANSGAASYLDSLIDPAISIVTAQELIVGARDKRDVAGIDSLVSAYPVIHVDASIGQLAYDLLKRYAKSDGLRTFDSLIAATAIMRGFELVSRNRKHFAMIDGLRLESPLY
jgi:predicted nucleic acid-binding protein